MSNVDRAILTIATGKPIYLQMAVNLARSFKRWHKKSDIQFTIATDQKALIPSDLSDVQVIELTRDQYGTGFSPKLHLDKIASAKRTLFVDADCLIYRSLDDVFERFAGHAVSVVGDYISEGDWFGDVSAICQRFSVPALPKFNGGIYYLEKGILSDRIYTTARALEPRYDEIGLARLRGRPNDELLMAIAMAVHGQSPIVDDGSIMSDPQCCPGKMRINILCGQTELNNPPAPHPQHQSWYPFETVSPAIVHFLGSYTQTFYYISEKSRLKLTQAQNISIWQANLYTLFRYAIPLSISTYLKNLFRPLYHFYFGYRSISKSNRI